MVATGIFYIAILIGYAVFLCITMESSIAVLTMWTSIASVACAGNDTAGIIASTMSRARIRRALLVNNTFSSAIIMVARSTFLASITLVAYGAVACDNT